MKDELIKLSTYLNDNGFTCENEILHTVASLDRRFDIYSLARKITGQFVSYLAKAIDTGLVHQFSFDFVEDELALYSFTDSGIYRKIIENPLELMDIIELGIDQIHIQIDTRLGEHNIDGVFYPDINMIKINFKYDKPIGKDLLSSIYMTIAEFLAHEFTHASQKVRNPKTFEGYSSPDDFLQYYLDPVEIEAFVRDIATEARFVGVSFERALDKRIRDQIHHEVQDPNAVRQIRDTYLNFYYKTRNKQPEQQRKTASSKRYLYTAVPKDF